jgi:hypothetical protein
MMPFMGVLKPKSSGIKVSPLIDPGKKGYIEIFGKPPLATGSVIFEGGISAIVDYVKEITIYISYLI